MRCSKKEFSAVFGTELGQPRHAKLRAVRSTQTVLHTRTHVNSSNESICHECIVQRCDR